MLLHILKRKVKKPTIVSKYTMHMTKENGVNSGVVLFLHNQNVTTIMKIYNIYYNFFLKYKINKWY